MILLINTVFALNMATPQTSRIIIIDNESQLTFRTGEFKAKVGPQALTSENTVNEPTQQHNVHAMRLHRCEAEIQA